MNRVIKKIEEVFFNIFQNKKDIYKKILVIGNIGFALSMLLDIIS